VLRADVSRPIRAASAKSFASIQQIVALRLRHHSFAAIGRVVGISKQNAQKAFLRALRRQADADIQTVHRSELAQFKFFWQSAACRKRFIELRMHSLAGHSNSYNR
jgi:hypothetical protein